MCFYLVRIYGPTVIWQLIADDELQFERGEKGAMQLLPILADSGVIRNSADGTYYYDYLAKVVTSVVGKDVTDKLFDKVPGRQLYYHQRTLNGFSGFYDNHGNTDLLS